MIFISLAAYLEPLLAHTIAHACRQAEHPQALVFGVIDQHPHSRRDELLALHPDIQLRYVHVHPVDTRGVCWARTLAFSLYRGEDYLLQIDSHMIFDLAWDSRLIAQLKRLQGLSAKPIVTNYPWGFTMEGRTPVIDPARTPRTTLVLKPHPECSLSETNATLRFTSDHVTTDSPVPACHIGAGYLFTLGRFVQEVPYDPELYFHGEEQSLTLRAYTRGWDSFHLQEIPLYHQYKQPDMSHDGHHWHGHWAAQRDVSHAQATHHSDQRLLDLVYQRRDLGIYGLGTARTLADYAQQFGIDYPARQIRPRPDLPFQNQSRRAPAPPAALTVVEVNPHAPRPYVFTDCSLCMVDSLKTAGIEAQRQVNTIPVDGTVIIMGWTPAWLQAHRQQLSPSRTLLFNAEQLASGSGVLTPEYLAALGQYPVLDYHEDNANFIHRLHGANATVITVPLIPGPSVRYALDERAEPTVDVLFYGSVNPRRERILQLLRDRGLTVEVVSGAYGWELTPALRRARLVLHVHYFETRLYPALRMLQPVALGVPVVCETSEFSRWNDWSNSGMVFADYEELPVACEDLIKNPERAAEVALSCSTFAMKMEMVETL